MGQQIGNIDILKDIEDLSYWIDDNKIFWDKLSNTPEDIILRIWENLKDEKNRIAIKWIIQQVAEKNWVTVNEINILIYWDKLKYLLNNFNSSSSRFSYSDIKRTFKNFEHNNQNLKEVITLLWFNNVKDLQLFLIAKWLMQPLNRRRRSNADWLFWWDTFSILNKFINNQLKSLEFKEIDEVNLERVKRIKEQIEVKTETDYPNPFAENYSKMEIDWREVDLLEHYPSKEWIKRPYKLKLSTWLDNRLNSQKILRAKNLLSESKKSSSSIQFHLWKVWKDWLQTLSESRNSSRVENWASVPKIFNAAYVLKDKNSSNWKLSNELFCQLVDLVDCSCNKTWISLSSDYCGVPLSKRRIMRGKMWEYFNEKNNNYNIWKNWVDISPLGMGNFFTDLVNWKIEWHEDLIKLMFHCHTWANRIRKYLWNNIAVWHKTWTRWWKVHDSWFLNVNWEYYTLSITWANNSEDIALLTAAILDDQGIQSF